MTTTEYLTPQEVAKILKVHENTVWRWLKAGTLKGAKIGDSWRVLRSDLPNQ
jgi:excisionase family DNA binding protein